MKTVIRIFAKSFIKYQIRRFLYLYDVEPGINLKEIVKYLLIIILFILPGCLFGQDGGVKPEISQDRLRQTSIGLRAVPIYYEDGTGSSVFGFGISPNIGFFLSKHFSIESSIFFYYTDNLSYTDQISGEEEKSSSTSFGLLLSGRYHVFPGKRTAFFAELGVGSAVITYCAKESDPVYDPSELNAGCLVLSTGIGMLYSFSPRFDLEVLVPYIIVWNVTNGKNSDYPYNGLAGPTIGLRYRF